MKKITVLLLISFILGSCVQITNDTYYTNENFILIKRNETEKVVAGNTRFIRTWVVQRVVVEGDSVMVGKIEGTEGGCGCGIINDENWKEKQVGDTLYFEYILKSRFKPVVTNGYNDGYDDGLTETSQTSTSITSEEIKNETIINMNRTETERLILEKEREILSIEREIESLKESLEL